MKKLVSIAFMIVLSVFAALAMLKKRNLQKEPALPSLERRAL